VVRRIQLPPGEGAVVAVGPFYATRAQATVDVEHWIEPTSSRFEMGDVTLSPGGPDAAPLFWLETPLTNRSASEEGVRVVSLFYDASGRLIGGSNNFEKLPPSTSKLFRTYAPGFPLIPDHAEGFLYEFHNEETQDEGLK
jgi:hypothetical protein